MPNSVDVSERGGRLSPRARDAIALTVVALVFALPLRGLLRAPGPPMEEGFMLVFPERVLHGAIPNRDFLHLYGPGSLWALAGVFKVFGVILLTERVFGLAQQIAIVFGIYALARRWGRTIAVCGAVTSALIIIPVRPHRARVGRWRRPRRARARGRSRPLARSPSTTAASAARAAGRSARACCSGWPCCSGSISSLAVGISTIALVARHAPAARQPPARRHRDRRRAVRRSNSRPRASATPYAG